MRGFIELIRFEIVLLLRSRMFWLMAALAVISILVPTFQFLILQFIAVSAIARSPQSGFEAVEAGLGGGALRVFGARAVALLLVFMGLWPIALGAAVLATGAGVGGWSGNVPQVAWLCVKYGVLSAAVIGLVFLFRTVTAKVWKLNLTVILSWVLWTILVSNLSYLPPWSSCLVFGYGVMKLSAPSTLINYQPDQELLPSLVVCHLALATAFFLFSVAVWERRRDRRAGCRTALLLLIPMVVGGVAGGFFTQTNEVRERGFRQALAGLERLEWAGMPASPSRAPELEAVDLTVRLRTAERGLDGKATLRFRLSPGMDTAWFTLRDCFQVTAVTEAGTGRRLEFERQGSSLAVRIPDGGQNGARTSVIEVAYSGQVWEWYPGPRYSTVNLVDPAFSLLRSGHAWYPVAGVQPLYERAEYWSPWGFSPRTTVGFSRASHQPVPFTLTVETDSDAVIATNLPPVESGVAAGTLRRYRFESAAGRDVYLTAGPYRYEERKLPGLDKTAGIYYYKGHEGRVGTVLEEIAPIYGFYSERFGSGGAPFGEPEVTVLDMPPFLFLNQEGLALKELSLTDTILLPESNFASGRLMGFVDQIRRNKRDIAVLQRWWQADMYRSGTADRGRLIEGVMLFYYALYPEESRGRDFYEQVRGNLQAGVSADSGDGQMALPFLPSGKAVRAAFLALDAVQREGGEKALLRLSRTLYDRSFRQGGFSQQEFLSAMREASKDWPEDRQAEIRNLSAVLAEAGEEEEQRFGLQIELGAFYLEEWAP